MAGDGPLLADPMDVAMQRHFMILFVVLDHLEAAHIGNLSLAKAMKSAIQSSEMTEVQRRRACRPRREGRVGRVRERRAPSYSAPPTRCSRTKLANKFAQEADIVGPAAEA